MLDQPHRSARDGEAHELCDCCVPAELRDPHFWLGCDAERQLQLRGVRGDRSRVGQTTRDIIQHRRGGPAEGLDLDLSKGRTRRPSTVDNVVSSLTCTASAPSRRPSMTSERRVVSILAIGASLARRITPLTSDLTSRGGIADRPSTLIAVRSRTSVDPLLGRCRGADSFSVHPSSEPSAACRYRNVWPQRSSLKSGVSQYVARSLTVDSLTTASRGGISKSSETSNFISRSSPCFIEATAPFVGSGPRRVHSGPTHDRTIGFPRSHGKRRPHPSSQVGPS